MTPGRFALTPDPEYPDIPVGVLARVVDGLNRTPPDQVRDRLDLELIRLVEEQGHQNAHLLAQCEEYEQLRQAVADRLGLPKATRPTQVAARYREGG